MKINQFIPLAPVPMMARLICSARPGTIPVLNLGDGLLDFHQPVHIPSSLLPAVEASPADAWACTEAV